MTEPEPATGPQLTRLAIQRKTSYGDDRAAWFQWVEAITGRVVESNKQLTKAECSVLIDLLVKLEARRDDEVDYGPSGSGTSTCQQVTAKQRVAR